MSRSEIINLKWTASFMITSAKAQDLFYVGDVARQLPTPRLFLISNDFYASTSLVTFNRLRVRRDGKIEELEASGQSTPGLSQFVLHLWPLICLINLD